MTWAASSVPVVGLVEDVARRACPGARSSICGQPVARACFGATAASERREAVAQVADDGRRRP